MKQYFKGIFCLVTTSAILLTGAACSTTSSGEKKEEKPLTAEDVDPEKYLGKLRIYLETHEDGIRSQTVKVLRAKPFDVTVDKFPILTEELMNSIRVVNTEYGYHMEVQMDQRGSWLLESYTATNNGRRLIVYAEFPEKEWIAAPIIRTRLGSGTFNFIPDASVDEANRIAMTVSNSIRKIKKIKKPSPASSNSDSSTSRSTKLRPGRAR